MLNIYKPLHKNVPVVFFFFFNFMYILDILTLFLKYKNNHFSTI